MARGGISTVARGALIAFLAFGVARPGWSATLGTHEVGDLNGRKIAVPASLPAPRTLLLVAFRHGDRAAIDGWKAGLGLKAGQPDWIEMPVIGVSAGFIQGMILSGMKRRYPAPADKAHMAPLFGDGDTIARELGIASDRVAALVVDREGHVLASASGAYSAGPAHALLAAWRGER